MMAVCHIVMSILAGLPPTESVGLGVLVIASLFVAAFAVGWGPVPWTLCAEIFPMRLRSRATSVTTAVNWLANTILGKAFPLLPLDLAFGLFAIVCLLGCSLAYLAQPETANLTLEEIDFAFAKHRLKARRAFWREAHMNAIAAEARLVRQPPPSDGDAGTRVSEVSLGMVHSSV